MSGRTIPDTIIAHQAAGGADALSEVDDIGSTLPIFPLSGCLLLPRANLPLQIFEPRYRAMIQDALDGAAVIGMVQPRTGEVTHSPAPIYHTGCLGKVTSHQKTEDGRFFLILSGLCRFDIDEELPLARGGYRLVHPSLERYIKDLQPPPPGFLKRDRLLEKLRHFATSQDLRVSWEDLRTAQDEELVNAICMGLPLDSGDKQTLLEARDPKARAEMLMVMLEMEIHTMGEQPSWAQ